MLRNTFTFKRLFNFNGRATRREYFLILGTVCAAWILLLLVVGVLFPPRAPGTPAGVGEALLGLVAIVVMVLSCAVMLAALVRRVHDHDKSWLVILLNMIPLVGWIFWLISTLTPGNPYENSYGPDPRDPMADGQEELEAVFR
jgi:uncharacterized membrane protein YhaH (DUF805 family)